MEGDAALARRFQPVMVEEPSVEQAAAWLRGLAPRCALLLLTMCMRGLVVMAKGLSVEQAAASLRGLAPRCVLLCLRKQSAFGGRWGGVEQAAAWLRGLVPWCVLLCS